MKIRLKRQMIREANGYDSQALERPCVAYNIMSSVLEAESNIDQQKEHFWIIGLTQKNRVKFIELVSLGTLTATLIHPREVLRPVIQYSCASFICVHNHPSGGTEPSKEDMNITQVIKDASEVMGIQLLDHVIIGNGRNGFNSLFESNPHFQTKGE